MFESLRSLSDSQIITGSKVSRAQEHSGLLSMIGFIVETERRELFLRRGYSSLFDYCMKELGYSESQAMRRITAARCVARFPAVFELLKVNEINLGTISRVSRLLTPENCGSVLESIRKKSLREVEAIVAEHAPIAAFPRDRVRTIVARIPLDQPRALGEIHLRNEGEKDPKLERSVMDEKRGDSSAGTADEFAQPLNADRLTQDHTAPPISAHKLLDSSAKEPSPGVVAKERLERRARVEFTARQELMEKLERVRALASHRLPARPSIEQLLDFMADYVICREDPVKRHARRQARQSKRDNAPD